MFNIQFNHTHKPSLTWGAWQGHSSRKPLFCSSLNNPQRYSTNDVILNPARSSVLFNHAFFSLANQPNSSCPNVSPGALGAPSIRYVTRSTTHALLALEFAGSCGRCCCLPFHWANPSTKSFRSCLSVIPSITIIHIKTWFGHTRDLCAGSSLSQKCGWRQFSDNT